MRRRDLLGGAAAAAALAPFGAAVQPGLPIIGYFNSRSAEAETPIRTAFLDGLQHAGFVVSVVRQNDETVAKDVALGTTPLGKWWGYLPPSLLTASRLRRQGRMAGATTVAGSNLALIDVTTTTGANNAIKIADEAITQVSQLRANLGAFQKNTLESTVRYLGVGVENLSASESQIRDTNVASEVVSLTKNQILQQAGTSVLAQANSQPQLVLNLLR